MLVSVLNAERQICDGKAISRKTRAEFADHGGRNGRVKHIQRAFVSRDM